MSNDSLCIIILSVMWSMLFILAARRIDNLNYRIKKLEEQVKEDTKNDKSN